MYGAQAFVVILQGPLKVNPVVNVGLELLKFVKPPSTTTFPPKHPVIAVQEPGTTQDGLGTYAAEVQPLLVTVIEGVEPVGIALLVKVFPLKVPVTPFTV
jgi:hypothetical protein